MAAKHSYRKRSRRPKTPAGSKVRASAAHYWRQWIRPILPVVLVAMTFRGAVADWNDVPTGSMKPTILEGDRIFVNKLAFGLRIPLTYTWIAQWGEPERGDVVVLHSPANDQRLVKRLIGQPGDVIQLRNNTLHVNGAAVTYSRADRETIERVRTFEDYRHLVATEQLDRHPHPVMLTPGLTAPRTFGKLTVPAGHYFVMGDNRDMSADSRMFGVVARERIVGRSGHVVISFDPENWHLPRMDRLWHRLP